MKVEPGRLLFLTFLIVGSAVACNSTSPGIPNAVGEAHLQSGAISSPIEHVVIVIQENRSFDNFFSTFPNANGTTVGQAMPMPTAIAQACAADGQPVITRPTTVPLTEVTLMGKGFPTTPPTGPPFGKNQDPPYIYGNGYLRDCDSANGRPTASQPCRMDGFDVQKFGPNASAAEPTCTYLYQYVDPHDVAPYWDMAKQYVLADKFFQSQGSSSFPAHQDLIAAGTQIDSEESAINNPTGFPWGCDSGTSAHEPYITLQGKVVFNGPRPCYPTLSHKYATVRDILDAKGVSWKFYANKVHPAGSPNSGSSGIWSAFDAIEAVRYGDEWGKNVVWPDTRIFSDLKNGTLPAVSWITPNGPNSDHPQEKSDTGPSWVASIVNAVGESKYWKSSAVIVIWDDFGGFYDHVPPPFYDNQGGLGFRIPLLIISPYVHPHVEHTQYETASVVKFLEENWQLGTLHRLDRRANGLESAFDLNMSPRRFRKIPAKYPLVFFLHQPMSLEPPDTQ